jgi:diguanylate cyclase (GGDEF)-like protein
MVAPLGRGRRATDRSIGLVAALNKNDRDFTGHELSLLAHFARHAGLILENAQLYKRAEHLALHDGLTNLYNHRHFVATLNAEIAKATQITAPVSLIMADIDNFKRYNDTHGHQSGDALLRDTARALGAQLRLGDLLARYGGEEFAVLLHGCDLTNALKMFERLQGAPPEGQTFSAGVADSDGREEGARVLARADKALYRAKAEGRNRTLAAEASSEHKARAA